MKKKKKATKRKQKIDVVLASLLNLEIQVKKLIDRIDSLENKIPNYPIYHSPQKYPEQPIVLKNMINGSEIHIEDTAIVKIERLSDLKSKQFLLTIFTMDKEPYSLELNEYELDLLSGFFNHSLESFREK